MFNRLYKNKPTLWDTHRGKKWKLAVTIHDLWNWSITTGTCQAFPEHCSASVYMSSQKLLIVKKADFILPYDEI